MCGIDAIVAKVQWRHGGTATATVRARVPELDLDRHCVDPLYQARTRRPGSWLEQMLLSTQGA